jgi:urease accessory protein
LLLSLSARIGIGIAGTTFLAAPALAHEDTGAAGGLVSGFSHPFAGADHLLAMVAVGIWGSLLGRPLSIALPVLFPVMMAAGAVLALWGLALPPVEAGIAASMLVLGAAIAARYVASVPTACAVVGLFALFHGYAHGAELPYAAQPLAYIAGFVAATGVLHIAGIALGEIRTSGAGLIALRAGGALIAALGTYFLGRLAIS